MGSSCHPKPTVSRKALNVATGLRAARLPVTLGVKPASSRAVQGGLRPQMSTLEAGASPGPTLVVFKKRPPLEGELHRRLPNPAGTRQGYKAKGAGIDGPGGVLELGVIEDVEELDANLEGISLLDLRGLL